MIDTHTHIDTRGMEDLELMALTLDCVITLAHDPFEMKTLDVWITHIEKVFNEIKRGKKIGLNVYIGVGIHPRAIPPDVDKALEYIKNFVKEDRVVAIGEIGLEKGDKREKETFIKQLELANNLGYPAIVHTPRSNKEEITKLILEEINTIDTNIPIVIDHCNKNTVKEVLDNNFYAGLTVQPGKLTHIEAVEIIKEYKDFSDKILLNSDTSSNFSDVLAVPRTVLKLKLNNIEKEVIDKVSYLNAINLFKLK
ncbi:TatD family hydrolase [Methanocaldococcus indicus]|uniref:TatD family hydrolase n=1 Tax=Methanocaldococcus indicus TaxID=213231 RepID=UPI003C6D5E1D